MSLRELLEECYRAFPRKLGKSQGIKNAQKTIKTSSDIEKLKVAVLKYSEHVKSNKLEPKFIMHFSTFMNQWEDWLEPDVGSTVSFGEDKWTKLKTR